MFTTGIFINEYHLDFKTTTTGNKTTKAPVAIGFSTALMPKPEPVSNPPASETVDAGLGPKPDPIPRPPSTALLFKFRWVSMVAPSSPSVRTARGSKPLHSLSNEARVHVVLEDRITRSLMITA
jgi:hypothetical protein